MRKLFLFVTCIFFSLFLSANLAFAEDVSIAVEIDGDKIEFKDAEPFVDKDNRTQVPVRFISENIGASVDWIPEQEQVVIEDNDSIIRLAIGETQYTVNQRQKTMDTAPRIKDARTVVPLRFVVEGLGLDVDWEGDTNTVKVNTENNDFNGLDPAEPPEEPITDEHVLYLFPVDDPQDHWARSDVSVTVEKSEELGDDGVKVTVYQEIFISSDYEDSIPPEIEGSNMGVVRPGTFYPPREDDEFSTEVDDTPEDWVNVGDVKLEENFKFEDFLTTFGIRIVTDLYADAFWDGEGDLIYPDAGLQREPGLLKGGGGVQVRTHAVWEYDVLNKEIEMIDYEDLKLEPLYPIEDKSFGAKINDIFGFEGQDRYIAPPEPIELDVRGIYRDPDTGDYREIEEDDLESYEMYIRSSDGELIYAIEEEDIDISSHEDYKTTIFEISLPSEQFIYHDDYTLSFVLECEEGVDEETFYFVILEPLEDKEKEIKVDWDRDKGSVVMDAIPPKEEIGIQSRYTFVEGTEIDLLAYPEDNHRFGGWKGDIESKDREITVVMDENKELKAEFLRNLYIEDLDISLIEEDYVSIETDIEISFNSNIQLLDSDRVYLKNTDDNYKIDINYIVEDNTLTIKTEDVLEPLTNYEFILEKDSVSYKGNEDVILEENIDINLMTQPKIRIPEGSQSLRPGEEIQVTAERYLHDMYEGVWEDVTDSARWSSEKSQVARVEDGKIQAVSEGRTRVYVNSGGYEYYIPVTVIDRNGDIPN